MAKKTQYRYYFEVTKRWNSYSSVTPDEYYGFSILADTFNTYEAEIRARRMVEKDCSNNYKSAVKLLGVEEV